MPDVRGRHSSGLVLSRPRNVVASVIVTASLLFGQAALPDPPRATPAGAPGRVSLYLEMVPELDDVFVKASASQRKWLTEHFARARVYSPFFDDKTAWFDDGLVYADAYAVYDTGHPDVQDHDMDEPVPQDQILSQSDDGRVKAFINYQCNEPEHPGICTQHAGDITNQGFRDRYVDSVVDILRRNPNYRGVFVDDINWSAGDWRDPKVPASDGKGVILETTYHKTWRGWTPLSLDKWQNGMRQLLRELRSALDDLSAPGRPYEIVPNAPALTAYPGQWANQAVIDGVETADGLEMERGFNDVGFVGGMGPFGFTRALTWVDFVHSEGRGVIEDVEATPTFPGGSDSGRDFALAMYFLMNEGRDTVGYPTSTLEADYWSGWDTELGEPKGARYEWEVKPGKYLLRRDFSEGFVLVNPPGRNDEFANAESTTPVGGGDEIEVPLGGSYRMAGGGTTNSVRLAGRRGVVLLGKPPALANTRINLAAGPGVRVAGDENDDLWRKPYMINDMAPANWQQGGTRWEAPSNGAENEVSLDLGEVRTISLVRIRWGAGYAPSYRIQTSDDGSSWTDVARQNATGAGWREKSFEPAVRGRHVRILTSTANPDHDTNHEINEVELLGPAGQEGGWGPDFKPSP